MAVELRTGEALGRFELLVQLGRGGMASVWVARERSGAGKERLIAVKAMLPELASRPDFRGMFLEEGQIVRSIEHQNVVQVYEVSEDRGVLYMAMEWVEGDSLRAVIREAKRRRAIPPEMAVRMIADTAGGLHAAHEVREWDGSLRGIVHCDVSPHNILIGLDGNAKLVDFGVANATQRSHVGDKDQIKGKFGYMSPEQARAKKLDRRSDVFSLGIVLFELTTGERLFKGNSPKETLALVASGKIPRPTEVYPKYPPRLEQVVLKALARDVEERYQTAAEFKEALERYLVAERILVSRASVAQLLKRVLGSRLEQQRGAIRDALRAIDGDSAVALVPTESTVPMSELIGASEVSFTGASGPSSASSSHSGVSSPRNSITTSEPPSTTTHSHFSQNSHTTQPQLIDSAPRPSRSGTPIMASLAAIIVVLSGAIVWVVKYRVPSIAQPVIVTHQLTPAANAGQPGPSRPAGDPARTGAGAVDLNSLPEAVDTPAAVPGGPAPAQAPGHPSNKKSEKVVLSESKAATEPAPPPPAPASAAPAPPPPSPPPPPAAPAAPPMSQRGPLNRGAAIAAVNRVMFSAASCKQPGGPTGSGRAQVTFSPEGNVSAVSVSAPFGGTGVGNCVAGMYRALSIPAFQGSPVTLPASFRIPD